MIEKTKVKAGRLIEVSNKNPKTGSNETYISVWVEDADGKNERCLLFTKHQIKVAEDRANKNEEDLTKKSWLTNLLD